MRSTLTDVAVIDDDGHAVLGETGASVARETVTARARKERAETTLELNQRRLDTVDLIIQGATLRQVAERHGIGLTEAREDYQVAMRLLNEHAVDRVLDMREEITGRQRTLILANMSKARMGDVKAATIVQRADQMLADIWGLRYIRPDPTEVPRDPMIAAALAVYLEKVAERVAS